eukprot:jgi/Botrbrau1/7309/Bobra.247_3s0004.1
MAQQLKARFKTPEGKYILISERTQGLCLFNPVRPIRLGYAELPEGPEPTYILLNYQDLLLVFSYTGTAKQPFRTIQVGQASSSPNTYALCHDHCPASDDFDTVVGLSSGDVLVCSLKAQLLTTGNTNKLQAGYLHFNVDGAADGSQCTSVSWVPGSNATAFVAGYASGNIFVYNKGQPNGTGSVSSRFSLKASGELPRTPTMALPISHKAVTAVKPSPDGSLFAVTARDGILRVVEASNGSLICGFKSYFGGLLCCSWSADGNYVAAGGEDDLVSVFGLQERCVVAWAEGHSSWVSACAFDPWVNGRDSEIGGASSPSGRDNVYRLASVGQDCQLLLHDIVVIAEDYLASLPPLSPKASALRGSSLRRKETAEGSPGKARTLSSGSDAPAQAQGHSHRKSASWNLPQEITPPTPRKEMVFTPPLANLVAHHEPMSDVLFTPDAIFTACYSANVKCWQRPVGGPPMSPITARRTSSEPTPMSL